jgi:hypothetical protein
MEKPVPFKGGYDCDEKPPEPYPDYPRKGPRGATDQIVRSLLGTTEGEKTKAQ